MRRIAAGKGWSVAEFICEAGPGDRPFEEKHDGVSVALVAQGSFDYRADTGRALLYPGALLLCNHGACYQCGHDHGAGDRCISVHVAAESFAEIAATAAGSSRFRFPVGMLPARRDVLPPAAMLGAFGKRRDPIDMEDAATRFMAMAIGLLAGARPTALRVSALDERRVARALRHMEAHADQRLDLDRIAGVAAMSKFHFLRVFRRVAGVTPHQYLLNLRLWRAAQRLLNSAEAVSAIAFDAGFGDLSTFNAAFRARFGRSPLLFRRQGVPP
ncbi:AraC family transcriptional regulator [Leptolyngbya sp. 15MV]|nr:AraC family transcriptional regulator [Leptolyngbya sp. 15MV]